MIARGLGLVIVLYVGCDLANPLMPGAVTFMAGSLDEVDATRSRVEPAAISAPSPSDAERLEAPRPFERPLRPARPRLEPLARVVPVARALPAPLDSPVPSEDQ